MKYCKYSIDQPFHAERQGTVHRDVRWRNIGKYRSRSGAVALVVFDLYDVVAYDVDAHHNWIEEAMHSLYMVMCK
jgi:hypothetical protein